jgi:hypothetical protein
MLRLVLPPHCPDLRRITSLTGLFFFGHLGQFLPGFTGLFVVEGLPRSLIRILVHVYMPLLFHILRVAHEYVCLRSSVRETETAECRNLIGSGGFLIQSKRARDYLNRPDTTIVHVFLNSGL